MKVLKKMLILYSLLFISSASYAEYDYSDEEIDDIIEAIEDRKNAKKFIPRNRLRLDPIYEQK